MARRRRNHQSTKQRAERLREEARNLFILSKVDANETDTLHRAMTMAKRAVLLDPTDYEALTLIGSIYAELDSPESPDRASEYFDRALALQPENPEAYASKAGLLLYVSERADDAEPLAKAAVVLSLRRKDPPELLQLQYITLIDVFMAQKRFAKAHSLIRVALRKCPTQLMASVAEVSLKQMASGEKASDT